MGRFISAIIPEVASDEFEYNRRGKTKTLRPPRPDAGQEADETQAAGSRPAMSDSRLLISAQKRMAVNTYPIEGYRLPHLHPACKNLFLLN